MKLIFFYSLIICSAANTALSQDTITVYFDNNWKEIPDKKTAVFYRKAFMDQNKVWAVSDYYISNKIQMTGTFKSKKLETEQGHFIYYYENGQKKSEGKYMNGNKEGTWMYWHENGMQESRGDFVEDRLEGVWEYWNESGEKASKGEFLHSVKAGLWNYWYVNGQLKCEEDFNNRPKCSSVGYYENGKIGSKGDFVNGKRQGDWIYYNIDGRIYFKGKFNNGVMVGEWIRFFPEGDMKLTYNNGILLGNQPGGIAGRE